LAGCTDEPTNEEHKEGKLIILQTGSADNGALSHSFVELYNAGNAEVDLNGYSIQYADVGDTDGDWSIIPLEGKIPPRHSFLIISPLQSDNNSTSDCKYGNITTEGDMIVEDFQLNNKGYKVVLLSNTNQLDIDVQNPFSPKVAGYVDMIGAKNNSGDPHGYETNFLHKISQQQSARRVSLTDTDDNDADFINVDFRAKFTGDDDGLGISVEEYMYPKNLAYGAWDPITGAKDGGTAPVIKPYISNVTVTAPTGPVTVKATVNSTVIENNRIKNAAPASVTLKYKAGSGAEQSVNMTKVEGNGYFYSGLIPAQAKDVVVSYTITATNGASQSTITESNNYTASELQIGVDYTKLILNEIDGNSNKKFVEIYNSGTVDIPMEGVKVDRNNGGSSWVGTASDSIPAGAYRLVAFRGANGTDVLSGIDGNPADVGWIAKSGISAGQTLKIAIIAPDNTPIDVFIRGDGTSTGSTTGVTSSTDSYSRMADENGQKTWAYATSTPGAANGTKTGDIVNPGYLTAQP